MAEKSLDVACIGLLVADVIVKPVTKSIFETDSTRVREIVFLPGGDAVNEAISLTSLGLKVALVAKIGADTFGEAVLRRMQEKKIDTRYVKPSTQTVTSTSLVLVNELGDRNIVFCAGNNDHLCLEDIDFDLLSQAKVVSIGSLCALGGLDGKGTTAIFQEAKKHGAITIADANIDIHDIGLEGISSTLGVTDYFIPSYGEACKLTGETEPKKISGKLLDKGTGTVIIKLGAEGCFIMNKNEQYTLSTYDVKVVDTTGCGDNFVAGFITGLLQGWDLQRCGLFANAVGSLNSMALGACSMTKTIDDVLDFMEKTPLCSSGF
jgi:sugar/nucleoside kinase (ribokinase family)